MVQPPFEIFLVPTWLRVPIWSGTQGTYPKRKATFVAIYWVTIIERPRPGDGRPGDGRPAMETSVEKRADNRRVISKRVILESDFMQIT